MPRSRLWWLIDLVVVGTLVGTAVAQIWTSAGSFVGGRAVHTVLAVACTVPLLVRRRYAAAVFAVVVIAAWVQLELGGGLGQPFFAVLIALYAVGAHAARPQAYLGPAAVVLQAVLVDVPRLRDGAAAVDEVVPAWFILLGVWGFGRWMRSRATAARDLQERAETAERRQREEAARAVQEERARIARELHDLVAHSMGVIVIQAQGAQRALDSSPARARQALASIETVGRNGLAEMRRLLDLLTDGADTTTNPQPTLEGVEDLVDQLRAAGMIVELEVDGPSHALPAGVELAGYRVVQEALTNSLKHSAGGSVRVRLGYGSNWLDIDVTDTGDPSATPRNGELGSGSRGLVGMRERVELYGGELDVGPRPDGGFTVHARLPVREGSS